MSRSRLSMVAVTAATALALVMTTSSAAAPKTVVGTVGPGYTIGLKLGGKKVTRLKAGTYRFVVRDRSRDHDFHLQGAGVHRALTGEEFVGRRTVVVRLRKGTYRFLCSPHSDEMRGSFKVT